SATLNEPYLQSAPMVYKVGNSEWHMFYISGIQWIKGKERVESQYVLMHAISTDGIHWIRNGKAILPEMVEYESQVSAAIMQINKKYHLFFCYRYGLDFRNAKDRGYKIGYASSDDLINWHRDDSKAGIEVSESGWDSEMLAYPSIMKINEKHIMFYCGNNFGENGFGYAELENLMK
ncbi:MAG: hypothetical protein FWG01_04760, partial [Betaproteobacteria bacterium]|nr:hypothetical protein [Betaproteobacteria bacterium]